MGKSGPKRTSEAVARDRVEIARMYLGGKPQADIARGLGLTQQQISYDLKAVRKAWMAAAVRDFDAMRAEELAKLDNLERTYWEAWERSLRDSQSRTVQGATDANGQMGKAGQRITVHTASSAGDPRWLEGVFRCIDQRVRLFGLAEAIKFEVDWRKEIEDAGVSAGDLFEEVVTAYAAALESGDPAVDG